MIKYVYIMGRGHSGSTVLDCLLDNAEGVQGVGETVVGLEREFHSKGKRERGKKVATFWNRVRDVCEDGFGKEWGDTVDTYRRQAHISKFPRTLLSEGEHVATAVNAVRSVYESVRKVSGKEIIVDSSKEVTRALLIAKYIDEGFFIHLVRDPVKVLSSDLDRIVDKGTFRFLRNSYDTEGKEYAFALLTCLNWVVGNLLCELVKSYCGGRCMTVRHENLRGEPGPTLRRIGAKLGVNVEQVVDRVEKQEAMSTGVGLSGNRMRRGDP